MSILVFSVYLFNFELSSILSRDYYSKGKNKRLIRFNVEYVIVSSIFGFLVLLSYLYGVFDFKVTFLISSLYVLEYYNKDFERVLMIRGQRVASSESLFIRSFLPSTLSSLLVMIYGVGISSVIGCLLVFNIFSFFKNSILFKSKLPVLFGTQRLNYKSIKKYIKMSFPCFLSIMIVKTVFILDKEAVFRLELDKDLAAAYMVFFSFSFLILTFNEIFVFSVGFPKILLMSSSGDKLELYRENRKILKKTIIMSVFSLFFIGFSVLAFIKISGKDVYLEFVYLFFILSSAFVLYSISQVYRNLYFCLGKERLILEQGLLLLIIFSFLFFILHYINLSIVISICFSLFFSMVVVLIRYIGYKYEN